ncbi:C1q domain protein [bacterium YEK0313]|nr:C1q domain protein [bacterium YEK0313]
MSYDKLLTADPGVWTITLTQNSPNASVSGILLVTAGAREGDAVLDDEGRLLVIKSLTETEITFAWPYKATTRTIDLVIEERSINRAINTASSAAAIAALARLQNAASLAPNYPVLSQSNTPPTLPADGDRYLVGPAPTGLWAGKAKHLALYSAAIAEWSFTPPADGMSVVLAGTSARLQYNGITWGLDALGADGGQLTGPLDWAPAIDVASGSTVDLGATNSNLIKVTGSATVSSFGVAPDGVWRAVKFTGVLTLAHSTTLALPTGRDIVTASGDWAEFISRGGGSWECASYSRADGAPLVLKGVGGEIVGDLTFVGAGRRILGDMTGTPIGNRLSFQTSVLNGSTSVAVLPNGTSPYASVAVINSSDPTNAAVAQLQATPTAIRVNSEFTGSAAPLPTVLGAGTRDMIWLNPDKSVGIDPVTKDSIKARMGLPTTASTGRFGRFVDTVGTLDQSQMSEDPSGNVALMGRLSVPNQPGFMSSWLTSNVLINSDTTVRNVDISSFQIPLYNQGGGFNHVNGRFTAPVSGVYLLISTISLLEFDVNLIKSAYLNFKYNDGTYVQAVTSVGAGIYHMSNSLVAPLKMAAGDYVTVNVVHVASSPTSWKIAQFGSHFGAQLLS